MRFVLAVSLLLLAGCNQSNVKELLDNVNNDCIIHGTFSAATGVPGNVTLAGTIDCAPTGKVSTTTGAPIRP